VYFGLTGFGSGDGRIRMDFSDIVVRS